MLLAQVLDLLPQLKRGLDVNCLFSSPLEFEYTSEISLFDLFDVRLVHGWIPNFPPTHFALKKRKTRRRRRPSPRLGGAVRTPQKGEGVGAATSPLPVLSPSGVEASFSSSSSSAAAPTQRRGSSDDEERVRREGDREGERKPERAEEEEKQDREQNEEGSRRVSLREEVGGEEEEKKQSAVSSSSPSSFRRQDASASSPEGRKKKGRRRRGEEEEDEPPTDTPFHGRKRRNGEKADAEAHGFVFCRCGACVLRRFSYNKLVEKCTEYREVLDELHRRQLQEIQKQQEEEKKKTKEVKKKNQEEIKEARGREEEEEDRGGSKCRVSLSLSVPFVLSGPRPWTREGHVLRFSLWCNEEALQGSKI